MIPGCNLAESTKSERAAALKLEVYWQNYGCLSTGDAGEKPMWSSACGTASVLHAPGQSLMDNSTIHLSFYCELL